MNLDEEVRDGFLVSKEMKKVWQVELDLCKKLLEVCYKHKLNVWACGGTMLGTVRHHGFIPWDDDIDMCMLREDYDKLLDIADKEFSHPYFFQTGYNDKRYPRGHAQLRNSKTTGILYADAEVSFNLGIFIDIFVYDDVPQNQDEFRMLKSQADKLQDSMLQYSFLNSFTFFTKPFSVIRNIKLINYFKKHPFEEVFKSFDDLFRQNKISEKSRIASIAFNRDEKRLRKLTKDASDFYGETVFLPFEDIMMPLPPGYKKLLVEHFGPNYMTPKKENSYHGGFACLDTEKSYKENLAKVRRRLRWQKLLKKFGIKRKTIE